MNDLALTELIKKLNKEKNLVSEQLLTEIYNIEKYYLYDRSDNNKILNQIKNIINEEFSK